MLGYTTLWVTAEGVEPRHMKEFPNLDVQRVLNFDSSLSCVSLTFYIVCNFVDDVVSSLFTLQMN